ncbi:MAG: hypothetical protein V1728_05985 [Candidatus Micrarchaeota archaeon]
MSMSQWFSRKNGIQASGETRANTHPAFRLVFELKPGQEGEIGGIRFTLKSLKTRTNGRMQEWATLEIFSTSGWRDVKTIRLEANTDITVNVHGHMHIWDPLKQPHNERYQFTCLDLNTEENRARFEVSETEIRKSFFESLLP